jgi:hypothetical protein
VVENTTRSPRTMRIYWNKLLEWGNSGGLCRLFRRDSMRSMYLWKSVYAVQCSRRSYSAHLYVLQDSAKSFDIPTKQCNPTLNACSASSRFLMFCGEHPASRPSRNGYRHRWWNSETIRTRMTPNHASRRPEQKRTVGNSTAGEAQRRVWITKGRRSARLRRPRSRLRNSVGTRQTTTSIR